MEPDENVTYLSEHASFTVGASEITWTDLGQTTPQPSPFGGPICVLPNFLLIGALFAVVTLLLRRTP